MKAKTYVSLVLYTRNEEDVLPAFLERVCRLLEDAFELYEVIVVDDDSQDASLSRAREVAASGRHHLTVVELARRHGVEAGLQAGLERCVGDWVFELESAAVDFPLELLLQMHATATRGYDVVTASSGDGSLRSRAFYALVNRYADLDEPLRTVRVRLASRRSLAAMLAMKEKVRYRKALYAVVGARQHHVRYEPLVTPATQRVQRRLDRETTSLAFDVLLSFSGFGLRLAHRLSLTFGLFSVFAVAYSCFVYVFKEDVVQGWTTLTVLVSGGFAGLFLVLGVLGEYLARILIEVRARPLYALRAADVVVPLGSTPAKQPSRFMHEQYQAAEESTVAVELVPPALENSAASAPPDEVAR